MSLNEGVAGRVFVERKEFLSDDALSIVHPALASLLEADGLHTVCAFPVTGHDGAPLGVIEMERREPLAPDHAIDSAVRVIGERLGAFIEFSQLRWRYFSLVDDLKRGSSEEPAEGSRRAVPAQARRLAARTNYNQRSAPVVAPLTVCCRRSGDRAWPGLSLREREAGARTGQRSPRRSRCVAAGPGTVRLGSPQLSFAALSRVAAVVYRRPGGAGSTTLTRRRPSFSSSNRTGVPTVVAVPAEIRASDCSALWYRVWLPGRAGGSRQERLCSRRGGHALRGARRASLIDLSDRRLTLFENGRPVLRVPVAVGAPATPTPRGRFFVVERIRVTDPGGPYGADALALSAFSEKLTYWPDGGPVAIHGTDDPSLDRSGGVARLHTPRRPRPAAGVLPGRARALRSRSSTESRQSNLTESLPLEAQARYAASRAHDRNQEEMPGASGYA